MPCHLNPVYALDFSIQPTLMNFQPRINTSLFCCGKKKSLETCRRIQVNNSPVTVGKVRDKKVLLFGIKSFTKDCLVCSKIIEESVWTCSQNKEFSQIFNILSIVLFSSSNLRVQLLQGKLITHTSRSVIVEEIRKVLPTSGVGYLVFWGFFSLW